MKVQLRNVVDLREKFSDFKNPSCKYSVSGRLISPETDILMYLSMQFIFINSSQVNTVFGSVSEKSNFYGGRSYNPLRSITEDQLNTLYSKDIKLALTLTNHYFSRETYECEKSFFEKYHLKGNVIICTSDELAKQIRKDFPSYKIRASIIKNINTPEKVRAALGIYDDVVIPMDMNDDDEFLLSLPEKDRLMLFANAACAYTCPSRVCYTGISKQNQGQEFQYRCTQRELGLDRSPQYFFDVGKFCEMGFTNFKLIPTSLKNYKF
jgi:hypothetical protein